MTALDNAPDHWERTTIGEIAEVKLGRQRSPKDHSGDHMRPYLRAANVDWYALRTGDIQEMNFTDDEMETYALREDDILIVEGSGSATEVGKCALVPRRYAGHGFQNTLIRVRANEAIDPHWLMYRINAEAELGGFLKLARGSGIFHLGSRRTGKWPIAVPPLEEQRAIASELSRLLSKARHAGRSAAAVSGAASLGWRSAVEYALREGASSTMTTIGEAATLVRNGGYWSGLEASPPGTPILRINAVRPGEMRLDERKYVQQAVEESDWEKYQAKPGSVLFTRYNGNPDLVGACAAVPPSAGRVLHPDKLIRVEPGRGLLAGWLVIAASGGATRDHIVQHTKTTSGQAGIAGRDLKEAPLPLPSRDLQARLVELVNSLRLHFNRQRATGDRVQLRAETVRRSILKVAFEGRLSATATETQEAVS